VKDDRLYLTHMIEHMQRILTYTQDGHDVFIASLQVQDAVIRNFEVIGEAAKQVSAELKAAYPDLPWRRIAGFRDVLIHNYSGINLTLVWNVVANDLPVLLQQVEQIHQALNRSGIEER
jgi:uncharacterized protein with HEPN domain